ncbi:hypothetical protein ABG768_012377 [Culter alburnus]|uniref:Immunoglobulin domain-containing protein n=1 Tax=Culter alburnus TaxID=194366 RepID=A0AAW1ZBC4_CULAL
MEKLIFFVIICFRNMLSTSSEASVRGSSDLFRVQMGDDITLNCSMRNGHEVAWYHLKSEELVLLISAEKDVTGRKLLTTYNQNKTRLKMTADKWITSVSLTISGVSESDSGLYFCGTKSDTPEMHFDKPIRLEHQYTVTYICLSVTELPKNVDVTDGVTVTERVLMFSVVGLAVFVFFLATVAAGGIIYHRGQQKGWKEAKRASLMSCKSAK